MKDRSLDAYVRNISKLSKGMTKKDKINLIKYYLKF